MEVIEILTWISVVISLIGAYLNATLRLKLCYLLWLFSNGFLFIRNINIKEYAQATMYAVYLVITFIGIKNTIKNPGWLNSQRK
ncbi:MAG: hypothetical protein LBH49_01175 [Puniceicoccales bacterium]|jgi:hypothetical protein|nr:hypothetical protein [Puniceicoccales bacterium]